MGRRRGNGNGNGNGNGYNANDWERDWRDRTDDDIAQLQRDYVAAGQAMIEVREWIKNHDKQHTDDRQTRQRIPDDVRGWIGTAIAIASILLTLYLQATR